MKRVHVKRAGAAVAGLIAVLCWATMATVRTATAAFPDAIADEPRASAKGEASIVQAGGCFWGVQWVYKHVKGVTDATSGYSGGSARTANYHLVSLGSTGHAESVRVQYDPSQISLGQLLKVFFSVVHDPTQVNRQGPDFGPQYRSMIFYESDSQRRIVSAYVDQLNAAKVFSRPIATGLAPLQAFYPAEPYHQDYAERYPMAPYILLNDKPKLDGLRTQYPSLFVDRK
jgi:peptide-methionine (S)-S-oxide reductase